MTTQVAFHFNAQDKPLYVCRLLRKAWLSGARAVVLASPAELDRIDPQLWTLAPQEFIPHARWGQTPPAVLTASPIVLTAEVATGLPHREVLIHLGQEMPPQWNTFGRVIEVVGQDEADRLQARQRWKAYTQAGYAIERHDLTIK